MGFEFQQGEALALLAKMKTDSVDAIISDPPYSSGGMFRGDRAMPTGQKYQQTGTKKMYCNFPGDSRDQRSYQFWMNLVLTECYRVARPGSPVVLFSDWRQFPVVSDILQSAGFVWRGVAVWDKTLCTRPRLGYFRQQAEFMLWGSKGPLVKRADWPSFPGVETCHSAKGGRFHQTGKPEELMRKVVRVCSPGGTILDPFAGSGSTGVAAAKEGRRFVGFEYTEHYAEVANGRLEEAYSTWEEAIGPQQSAMP